MIKKIIQFDLGILLFFLMAFTGSNSDTTDCRILHKGTFVYGNPGNEIKVVIKGKEHTEFHNGGKYIIESKLDWINDCEYDMTMTKVTIPNFPLQVGAVMNVKIDSVKGNEIFYTSVLKNKTWNGKFLKIEE